MAQAPIRNDIAKVHAAMPGCGLAAYTGVLLVIMGLGGTMMLMSGLTVFASSDAARPTRLMYGGDANPSLLNGMRYFGLLADDKVPEVLHTENWSGTVVCAIADEVLLRLEESGAWRLPVSSVEQAELVDGGVRIVGPWEVVDHERLHGKPTREITCGFEPNDGAERLYDMVKPN